MSQANKPTRKTTDFAISACSAEIADGSSSNEIRLIPAGFFSAVDGRPGNGLSWHLEDQAALAIVAAAAARTSDYVIDYEHQTIHAAKNGKPAPASGWYKQLDWRPGDGLYATDVRWNDAAAKMIEAKEYRYLSPVFGWNPNTGAIVSVAMAGLVNNPGLDGLVDLAALSALLSSEQQPEEEPMDELLEQLRWLLNLPVGATADDIKAQLQKLMDQVGGQTAAASFDLVKHLADAGATIAVLKAAQPDMSQYVPVATHSALAAELATFKETNQSNEIDRLVTDALSAGKLVPAQEQWARDLGKENLASLSAFIEAAPVGIVPGLTQTSGQRPEGVIDLNDANAIHQAALKFQSEQKQAGISITHFEAVAHVTKAS